MLASLLALFFILLTGTICTTATVTQITGLQGTSILLSPVLLPGFNTRDIFWRHVSPTDHLVASFSRGASDTTYQSCFYGRVKLLHNFTLEILKLELGDTGIFTCQMVDTKGHMRLHQFHLTVHEAVAKPEVQVFMFRGGTNCSVFLSCNTTVGSNVTYSWMTDTRQGVPPNTTYTVFDNNRLIKVLLTSTDLGVSFTCIVANPVSQEQTTVVPWNSCSFQQGTDSGVYSFKMILCIGVSLTISLISMMFGVCLCARGSGKNGVRKKQRTEEEETTARWNEGTSLRHQAETEIEHNEEATLQHTIETIV